MIWCVDTGASLSGDKLRILAFSSKGMRSFIQQRTIASPLHVLFRDDIMLLEDFWIPSKRRSCGRKIEAKRKKKKRRK